MKRVLAIFLSVLMLVMLCACSGGDNASVESSRWQLTGVLIEGIEVNGSDQLALYGIEGYIVFADGRFSLVLNGAEQTGAFSQKADIITLTDGSGDAIFGIVEGDTLTIEDNDVGSLYFTRQ